MSDPIKNRKELERQYGELARQYGEIEVLAAATLFLLKQKDETIKELKKKVRKLKGGI